jgi:putative peptide maturation dehydrogenase
MQNLIRRCAAVFVELSVCQKVCLSNLLQGGNGLEDLTKWLAYAPHLDEAVELQTNEVLALKEISSETYVPREELESGFGHAIDVLLKSGLLIESGSNSYAYSRDQSFREIAWWPLAAVAAAHCRWRDVRIDELRAQGRAVKYSELVSKFGPAPSHDYRRYGEHSPVELCNPQHSALDELLCLRRTCRNFDPIASVSAVSISTMMSRVWRAVGEHRVCDGLTVLRKSSPAGGGLHATEAYLLVQRADDLNPGVYHYLPLNHALMPLICMTQEEAGRMASCFLAGQTWFQDAPVLVIMTTRFERLFWKYRAHSKAWRVASLDAGHLSQVMYLSAADLGLGAFVSAAINDQAIEKALELDPLREGVAAIAGFGPRQCDSGEYEPDFSVITIP